MSVYVIPNGNSFLKSLAEGLIHRYGQDPSMLSQVRLFLPTKRACLSLSQHLAKLQKSGVTFTPKLIPLGEFDLEHIQDCLDPLALIDEKVLSSTRRQFLLAHLILKWGELQQDKGPSTFDHALNLAESLGSFFDQLQVEQIDPHFLSNLVPLEFAHHWQATLSFLHVVTEQWPAILAEENVIDRATYRNLLFSHLLDAFDKNPPQTPVIVAGSTGTFSMTSKLMKAVTKLSKGAVILSGLDQNMDHDIWMKKAESPTHPQHPLMLLCTQHGWDRQALPHWSADSCSSALKERRHYLHQVFSHQQASPSTESLEGLSLITCTHVREEAQLIALLVKDHWLHDTGDIAIITSDQMLIRYVETLLSRWGLSIDNSAGKTIKRTRVGMFFMHILATAQSNLANIDLLALLKACPLNSYDLASFEKKLRSQEGLGLTLKAIPEVKHIVDLFSPFTSLLGNKKVQFSDLLDAHLALFKNLFTDQSDPFFEALITQISDLIETTQHLPAIPTSHYEESLTFLLKQAAIRPPRTTGRTIYVWGSIEARLQKTDMVILAGLNEGTWPREIKPDPWINRSMRASLGLPPHERRIGLNAQDFCQAVCSEKVFLTRSAFSDGKIQMPSRFLHLLKSSLDEDMLEPQKPYLEWARRLDHPDAFTPSAEPLPKPALTLRPRTLSATHVERLVKNPYSYYARHILKLKPLDPLSQEPNAAHFGTLIHDLLEQHKKNGADLADLARTAFAVFENYPHLLCFWVPRFLRIAKWFDQQEHKRKKEVSASYLEIEGKATFKTVQGKFTLKAKADRIDLLNKGLTDIIDYKTGMIPTKNKMASGENAQLLLEALIYKYNGFNLAPQNELSVSYWQLKGKKESGDIKTFKNLADDIEETEKGLLALMAHYHDQENPYRYTLDEQDQITLDPYRLLSRIDEWKHHVA